MVVRAGARVVNVYGPGPDVAFDTPGAEIAAFEKAMEECKAEGLNVRAVVSAALTELVILHFSGRVSLLSQLHSDRLSKLTPAPLLPSEPLGPHLLQGGASRLRPLRGEARHPPNLGRDLRLERMGQPQCVGAPAAADLTAPS